MVIITTGHDCELHSTQAIIIIWMREAFEGRGLGVALVHEVFIPAVAAEEGAEKNESALCTHHVWVNTHIASLADGDGG
jgi:GNAT superfamily N-acetyltransferase